MTNWTRLPGQDHGFAGEVDRLRDAARRILVESDDFQKLLRDLK